MTHELILTSVSQGLEPDTHGYCVVAKDRRIPRQVVKRLETLSDYQHLFPPDSEEVQLQPVVYSHLIFSGHDKKTWHTLSRIAPAGIDYQREPNQLAHHVVLTEEELVPEGPAWLLALPGFHLTEWQTPTVHFAVGRQIPTLTVPSAITRRQRIARERHWVDHRKMNLMLDSEINLEIYRAIKNENKEQIMMSKPPSTPCPLWKEFTGDAGWGGILTETIRTGQQVLILFQPGQNILPLFVESLALLPPELMWKGTFSTCYFKDLPEHVACQWKAVLVGSSIANKLLKNSNQLILDLTQPLGMAPAGAYVEFARYGIDNTLPEEISENLFQDVEPTTINPDVFDEVVAITPPPISELPVTNDVPTAPLPLNVEKTSEDSVPGIIPSIIIAETFRIQPHHATKPHGMVQSVLNIQSRRQFYLLYGVTLLLLLVLLMSVVDQAADLGMFRLIFGSGKTAQKVVSVPPTKQARPIPKTIPKAKKESLETKSKLDEAKTLESEKKRQQKEEQAQLKTTQARKKQLQEQANTLRKENEKKKEQARTKLDSFLLEPKLPPFLPMSVPAVHENKDAQELQLSPPSPKIFSELNVLFPFGLALDLKLISLLNIPKVHIETRKLKLNRKIDNDSDDSVTAKPGQSEPITDAEAEELLVPDDSRFQWLVVAVDTETKAETPMFDWELTEQGLSIAWRIEGLENQHLYDTLAASLGFLRIQTENKNVDMTRIQSIPFFEPKIQSPIFIAKQFSDTAKPEFIVETPFAVQPWKTFFSTTNIPFAFQLDVAVKPESSDNLEGEVLPKPESPTRLLMEFQTKVDSKKAVGAGSDTYTSIAIPFDASFEPERLVWCDRYNDRINILKEEQKSSSVNLETKEKELGTVKDNILANGGAGTKEQREIRSKLIDETKELKNRLKEIENILTHIPAAHDALVKNERLRFEYSVSLVPPPREDEKEESLDRLRNEESLLIMKIQQPEPMPDNKPKEQTAMKDGNENDTPP